METEQALELNVLLLTFSGVMIIILTVVLFCTLRRINWVYARHLALRERHETLTRNVDQLCEMLQAPSDKDIDYLMDEVPDVFNDLDDDTPSLLS